MLKISFILMMLLALPAMAMTTGDPIDGNDTPISVASLQTPGCNNAERWPACVPCWTQCVYAMMAEAWTDGDWDNDDW